MRRLIPGNRFSQFVQKRWSLRAEWIGGVVLGTAVVLAPAVCPAADEAEIAAGKKVYDRNCVICHGAAGDGKGLIGIVSRAQQNGFVINTYPRDFTAAMYKFRSTSTGELPTDDDLYATVTDGIARSGMPSHKDLTPEQRRAVIAYIKTFSKRWAEEEAPEPIKMSKVPRYLGSVESTERGEKVYAMMQCHQCHGTTGRGDGPSAGNLEDNWGDKILPFDFTSGPLKGGSSPEKIYRTFVTGLDGTPMPSFEDSLSEEQRWDLVSYCLYLMKGAEVAAR